MVRVGLGRGDGGEGGETDGLADLSPIPKAVIMIPPRTFSW
jgi:hypothetical protein